MKELKTFRKYLKEDKKEMIRLDVWVNPKKKHTIELDADQLRQAVGSGHDNDWDWNINHIKSNLEDGDTEGETKITRYHGGGWDTVYWQTIR